MLWSSRELLPELLLLSRDANWAAVHVAHTRHDAALGDHRDAAEAELLASHQGSHNYVPASLHAAIHPQGHSVPQAVLRQHLLDFRQACLPRATGVHDAAQRRSSGAAVVARDLDDIRVCFRDTSRDGPDARTCHQLHRDLGGGGDLVQIEDELSKVLDRVEVVVRRRRDELDALHAVTQPGDVLVNLRPWELAAFAWLGALRDLDLQLLGTSEVGWRHTESARGHLLGARACRVSIAQAVEVRKRGRMAIFIHIHDGLEAKFVLATLAAVAQAADSVHGQGNGLMSLTRNSPKRHAACHKAIANGKRVLHLAEWQWLTIRREVQQVSDGGDRSAIHDLPPVLLVSHGAVLTHSLVQSPGHVRIVHVELPLRLEVLVPAGEVQLLLGGRISEDREGPAVEHHGFVCDVLERQGLHGDWGSLEGNINDLLVQADALEDLRTTVRLETGDAHLRHDLFQASKDGLLVVILALLDGLSVGLGGSLGAAVPLADVGQRQVRANRRGPVANEAGKVVCAPALASVHDDGSLCSQALLDEVVVDSCYGQQRRDGKRTAFQAHDVLLLGQIQAGVLWDVRQDDELSTIANSVGGLIAEV
mmetsp:Transcript_60830/g.98503  ORF Transcript_60830/g.98503 Transcript_60830/m.98503 type:complete len:592 (-) Transcript_60830:166-1941(-)